MTRTGAPGEIDLAYGRDRLRLQLPAHARPAVIRQAQLPALPDPEGAVLRALAAPIDAAPLTELARGRTSACIVVCDTTRPVPNRLFLRPMIEQIAAAGVPLHTITVLVATGLHRPNEGDELAELIGDPWVLSHVRVENHDARDDAGHRMLGRTATRGTPVGLDARFVEADLRIVTGLVEPHFMAGWSGGRKVIAPGVAHHETIRTLHSARFMADPRATQCVLEGNPLHEEQVAIVGMLGEVYALNTVIDEERRLAHVTFGSVVASHLASVEVVAASVRVSVPRRFRTVVTSAAGHPLDTTFYQTIKAMVTPLDVLEPGGTLIIASACAQGLGSAEFRAAQERLVTLGPDGFDALILDKQFADVDEWQTQLQLKSLRAGRVELFTTGLGAADRKLTGVHLVDDLAAAVDASLRKHDDPHLAVLPEGPYVIPYVDRDVPG
ncbi:MAG: nickel-dependent lactate racemase [Propionibacteriaceae bacterium]